MKKSKILCLVICVLSLISIIGFAAENTYYYYKDGEKNSLLYQLILMEDIQLIR